MLQLKTELSQLNRVGDVLWREVIASKYRWNEKFWWLFTSGSRLLKDPWFQIMKKIILFEEWFKIKNSQGDRTRFWKNKWLMDFMEFPGLFRIAFDKDSMVSQCP